jgi:signal transduction histidine kinase
VSDGPFSGGYRLTGVGLATYNAATFGVGLVTLYFTPSLIGLLATVDKAVLRMLLAPDQQAVLARRVEQLTESRDASVESSASELRRIERDLHDGAQQRLVGLAMDLGLAKERLARGEDPVRAAELVARAHEEAKLAISELRDLVRGIQPSILSEQGLDPALSALAARCPVPVEVDVQLASRPVASVESAAYFVVAEALANIAKHAEATRAWVRVLGTAQLLSVEVGDDGRGGAVSHAGGGLAGLDDRVRAVEGRLRVSSPAGGPTVLLAELPCAS